MVVMPQAQKDLAFSFRGYQFNDYARLAIHDGAVYGADPGLGKTFGIFTLPQLKRAWRTLIVAPEGLHQQIIDEGIEKFGITVKRINSQADFYADADLKQATIDRLNGRPITVRGWWITSYTQLGYNGGDEWKGKEQDNGEFLVTQKILNDRKLHEAWFQGADKGVGDVREYACSQGKLGIRCLWAPTLATLAADLFDCVECDEGVRLKSTDSFISLGVRAMRPKFRYVFTGTPIKNRLPDIFWLCHWAAGGFTDACARWPYPNQPSALDEFADAHMLIEENLTKEREHVEKKGYFKTFKKRTPRICNIHRLWKLLSGVVLRQRKDNVGEDIVPKTIIPIRVMPGRSQQAVYQWHCDNPPDFAQNGNPLNPVSQIMVQLTNLRQAALCPDSPNLGRNGYSVNKIRKMLAKEAGINLDIPPGQVDAKQTDKTVKIAAKGERTPFPEEASTAFTLLQAMIERGGKIDMEAVYAAAPSFRGRINALIAEDTNAKAAKSWTDHNPKQAAILQLIHDLLTQGEQVAILAPFQQFGETLYNRLREAGVSAILLDGKKSPRRRGHESKMFKKKVYSVVIGGIQSMSEGHSWEQCSHLILPSLDWAFDKNRQAEDRVHRLTSRKPVQIYVMVTTNTIDLRLENDYAQKKDSSQLALDGALFSDDVEEINLGQLLNQCIRNFNPGAPTVDELDIEQEWENSLKHKLSLAEKVFRQYHPPIIMDIERQRVTPRQVRQAVKATGGLVAIIVSMVKCVPNSTFGALIGTSDNGVIEVVRKQFTDFCAQGGYSNWRVAWKTFDNMRDKSYVAPKIEPKPVTKAAVLSKSARDFLSGL